MLKITRIKQALILPLLAFSIHLNAQTPGAHTGIDFEGTGDNVTIQNHSSLNPRTAMTVEAWIKADAFGSNVFSNTIVDKHDWVSGTAGYVLRCGASGVLSWNFASRSTGAWVETNSSAVMSTGVWYHVAGTFDGDTSRVYINGVLQNSTANTTQINVSTSAIRMGAMTYGKGRYFDGSIDEVRIWSSALSDTAIRDYMCRKIDRFHPNYNDLEAYLKMDEGTGTTTKDASSNSNSGTLSNSKAWIGSGAALGDMSWHTYTTGSLKQQTNYGETIEIKNIKGAPACTHIYLIDEASIQDMGPNYYGVLDSTHYFGVFQGGGTSPTYDLAYNYGRNATYGGTNDKDYDILENGTFRNWVSTNGKIVYAKDSLFRGNQTSRLYTNARYPLDSALYMKSSNGKTWFCEGESIELIAAGNDSFEYKWYRNDTLQSNKTNKMKVSTSGDYRVEATRLDNSAKFASTTFKITAQKKPNVTLSSLKGVCEDVDSLLLKGGLPLGGKYLGANIKHDSLFFPSRVGSGTYQVVYEYTDPSTTCTAYDTANQVVFALPNVYASGVHEFCDNIDSGQFLYGLPKGGTYTGSGIRNNYFHPNLVNYKTGLYAYSYTFTDSNQCSSQLDDSLELLASPNVFLLPIRPSCIKDAPIPLKGSPTMGTYQGKGIVGTQFYPSTAGTGSHQIIYSFTNPNGCKNSDTQTAIVHFNTQVSWTPNFTPCANGDSILLQGGTPSGGTYTGAGISNGYFHPSSVGGGSYDLSYVFTDTNSCRNTAVYKATVHDTSLLNRYDTLSLCPGMDSVFLNHVSPSGGTYSGSFINSSYFNRGKSGVGSTMASYLYVNSNSCVSITNFLIDVLQPDSVSIALPTSVCEGTSPVKIQVFPTGGTLEGKGVIGSFFSPSFAGKGTHAILYSYVESHQCKITVTDTITVAEIPTVSLTLAKTSFCKNDKTQHLFGGTPQGGTFKVGEVRTDSFDPSKYFEGDYQVRYSFANQWGCSDSTEQTVYVNDNPSKPNISNDDGILKSSANSGNQWYDESGILAGETGKDYQPSKSGKYWVIVSSDSGCTAQSDSFDFEFIGINTVLTTNILAFPNPSNGEITFLTDVAGLKYELVDLQGRVIERGLLKEKHNWKHLDAGVYQMVLSGDQTHQFIKIIIQH